MNNKLTPEQFTQAKAWVLGGRSYYRVGQLLDINPLAVSRALKDDPEIVALYDAGKVRPRKGVVNTDYSNLPYVIDVIQHGMTTSAAAKKHGISQPVVWQKVNKVREMMANRPAPTPQPTPPADDDAEIVALKALVNAYATRHALTNADVLQRLAE